MQSSWMALRVCHKRVAGRMETTSHQHDVIVFDEKGVYAKVQYCDIWGTGKDVERYYRNRCLPPVFTSTFHPVGDNLSPPQYSVFIIVRPSHNRNVAPTSRKRQQNISIEMCQLTRMFRAICCELSKTNRMSHANPFASLISIIIIIVNPFGVSFTPMTPGGHWKQLSSRNVICERPH